jgi:hypothetical protein
MKVIAAIVDVSYRQTGNIGYPGPDRGPDLWYV